MYVPVSVSIVPSSNESKCNTALEEENSAISAAFDRVTSFIIRKSPILISEMVIDIFGDLNKN